MSLDLDNNWTRVILTSCPALVVLGKRIEKVSSGNHISYYNAPGILSTL